MNRRSHRIALTVALSLLLAAALAGTARAQKGVIGSGAAWGDGITDPTDPDPGSRFVALPGRGGTLVARIGTDGGRIERWTSLEGRLVVPAVAYDGSPGGLSGDGLPIGF